MKRSFLTFILWLIPVIGWTQSITTTVCPGAGCIDLNVAGQGSLGVQITGTWVGTVTFQSSINGTTFVSLGVMPVNSTTSVSTTTGNGIWTVPVAGLTTVRVVFTAYTSGTATVIRRTTTAARNNSSGGGGVGSGTVTSVDLTAANIFTVTGNPITTAGTIDIALATQTANKVFASAVSGGAAVPAFRALVTADLPAAVVTGGTCTNQAVTAISTAGVPTCTTLTSAYTTGLATTAGTLAQFGATTSLQLLGVISDETGSGLLVFNNTPTFIAPILGTPTSGVMTNVTGTAAGLTAGNVTTNANLTGMVTSVGNAASLGSFSSANLLTALTDETGTSLAVFNTGPTLVAPVTLTGVVGSSALTINGATQTVASFPIIDATQTWNNAAITFTGIKLNITNTASTLGSMLLDLQIASTSVFKVATASGANLVTITGAATITGNTTFAGGAALISGAAGLSIDSTTPIFWGTSIASTTLGDTRIYRDTAGILGIRAGTAAMNLRVYNTFTTVTTAGEWLKHDWITTANQIRIGAAKGSSTGTARVMSLDYGGTEASPVAAISIPITSGNITFGGPPIAPKFLGNGTAPVVSNTSAASCGTTAATLVGTDVAGKVTTGTVGGTSCTVTFNVAWTNAPSCMVTNETTANLVRATSTTTTVILAGTFVAGDVLAYQCLGY